jgi:Family of unknown function (DUF6152)
MKMRSLMTLGLTLALAAGSALAHHSFAMFDSTREVVLDGTIREFQWTNPHSWIQLIVVEDGKEVEYSIEGSSPNILARRGWSKTTFNPGDRVKITVNPMKDGSKGGSFKSAEFPDGRKLGG